MFLKSTNHQKNCNDLCNYFKFKLYYSVLYLFKFNYTILTM
uniref:Uncharacterized protein n=1 Tax=Siphoviridae sp. cthL03 TaxID=2825615 RepID=A0A8S5PF80_9CAUD|nr:MAG TPA: hypothetical protein [Siphoviridae sp. cthL03]